MQICFKYSPTLDLNELRAVNKSQNFYQVFPSAAENISIIIILNSENFYLQSCTLCHLTCKNGVKERKKHHQTNTNSIKESKHKMTKRICVKGFNSVDGIRTGTLSQWIYIHHFFTCDRAVNEILERFHNVTNFETTFQAIYSDSTKRQNHKLHRIQLYSISFYKHS